MQPMKFTYGATEEITEAVPAVGNRLATHETSAAAFVTGWRRQGQAPDGIHL
jgi:hypothetical protein